MAERYNSVKGNPFQRLEQIRYWGTTSVLAGDPLVSKPESSYARIPLTASVQTEGAYIEDNVVIRKGMNCPIAEEMLEGVDTVEPKIIYMGDNIFLTAYLDADDSSTIQAQAFSVNPATSTRTFGVKKEIKGTACNSLSLCKMKGSSNQFCVAYRDEGVDDYLGATAGTINVSTLVITLGSEKVLNAAVINNEGTGITSPLSGIVCISFILNGDSKGYNIATTISSSSVIGTPGTAVVFNNAATKYPAITTYVEGSVATAYQDDGGSDYVEVVSQSVSATKVVGAAGTLKTLNAAAATSIDITTLEDNAIAISWVDTTLPHIIACTVSAGVFTAGTELQLEATACLTPSIDVFGAHAIAMVLEDDAHAADVGKVYYISRTGVTLTKTYTEWFTSASTETPVIATYPGRDGENLQIFFNDAADSDRGKIIWCRRADNIIDVRSNVNSGKVIFTITPSMTRKRDA